MAKSGKTVHVDILRSQLGRVRGLGAARAGSGQWWAERLTGIALVPLSLWFIASVIRLEHGTRANMIGWLHAPVPLTLMLCLIVATFWHMDLGLRVVVEDYVHHEAARLSLLLLIRGVCIVAALLCFISALRLGL
jgi:succinate dehydrogenase / fumarate reductase membrane anchor subunit